MATNTTSTSQTHNGNGSTATFAISFSFLENTEIDVTVGGVLKTLGTHYNISGSSVTFTSGNIPPSGTNNIRFQRDTDISAKKVDFADGSVLTETDLDNNSDQILFAQQEITDKLGGIEEGATADQTNAEIKTAYEANSDTNAFTDALLSKLNGIEAGATANQTNAEIRAAVEAASDSNVFTDNDHSKLNGIEAGATADQTVSEIKSLIAGSPLDASHLAANSVDSSELVDGSVDHSHLSNDCVDGDNIQDDSINSEHYINGSIDAAHIANNAVITSKIADAELKTLAGMQSGTASKLADSTALTADLADLNQLDGMAKQTTITDDDTKFPTSGAIVDYVAAQLAPIGGLEVIATDAAFPNTQPAAGVVISIADAGGLVVNSSGTSTTARTVGGATVTINNFASNFNSSTVDAGVAIMVSSTGTGQVYNYHKATLKEADLLSLSNDINDFAARYRVTTGEPTSNNDEGDLIYDKNADKMKVFDSTTNAFKEVTSVGDFKFLFLCPNGGSGSPTINGSIATYDLREGSNSGAAASVTNAAQLLVSVNGVLQKPNTGTSAPSEGFAMVDSNTIIFGSNLPTGAEVFVIQIGSAVALQVPADNTVATAKLQNGSVTNAKVNAAAAIDSTKLSFTHTGTGATARTVDSKLEDVVSAKDFGALGDNSNDDTAELQAALNAAAGKTLLIPKGIYLISKTLIIKEGTRIIGSGKADISEGDYTKGTVIKTTGSGTGQVWTDIASGNDAAQTPCLVAGGNGIYIENLTVLTAANNWSIGILFPCVKQCSISKVSMRGFTNACLYLDASRSNLNKPSVTDQAGTSVTIDCGTGMNEFYAEDFIFRSNTNGVSDFGIKIQGTTRDTNPSGITYQTPTDSTTQSAVNSAASGSTPFWVWGWGGASDIVFNSGRTSGISIDGALSTNAAKVIQGQRFIGVDSRVSTNGVLVNIDRANRVDFISGYGETVTNSKIKLSHRTGIVNFLLTAYRGTVNYLNSGGSTTTHGTLGSSRIIDADDSSILDLTVYSFDGFIRSKFYSITESPSNLAIDGKANEAGLQFRASDIIPRDNGSATNLATDLGDASFSFRDVYARGILFNGDSGSSNRLDDYEEGSWSPAPEDGNNTFSYGQEHGRYTKIGNVIHVTYSFNASLSSTSGFALFINLPFQVKDFSNPTNEGIGFSKGTGVEIQLEAQQGQSRMKLRSPSSGAALTPNSVGMVNSVTKEFRGAITYLTT